jgi:hypothetical protein
MREFKRVMFEAIQNSDVSVRDKMRLRMAVRFNPQRIAEIVHEEALIDGCCSTEDLAAVDWDALLAFIEKLIPLILQIISLFS